MKIKWQPLNTERKFIEIEQELFEQRLEELAELFYDAFCELHRNRSVEPKPIDFEQLQNQIKAG